MNYSSEICSKWYVLTLANLIVPPGDGSEAIVSSRMSGSLCFVGDSELIVENRLMGPLLAAV